MASEVDELWKLLESFDTAILVTRGDDGHYHARPMEMQHHGPAGALWFCTSMDSDKIKELRAEPHCAVALHAGGISPTYVSISGLADIVQDKGLIQSMWRPSWRAWFPDGPTQPDLVLLRVRPEHVEYMNPSTGRLKVLATMIRRMVTHERVEPDEKHRVDLPH